MCRRSSSNAPVGFEPREVYPGVRAMAMDTEASLREYLKVNVRVPILGRLGPLAHALDFVANAAPGVKEILTIGKIVWETRESIEGRAEHDIVIVDAAATGHIVAQLGAPDAIQELMDVGPLREQTRWVAELDRRSRDHRASTSSRRPRRCRSPRPSSSSRALRAEVEVPLGVVIVNRVLPELFTHSDEETFEALREPEAIALLTEQAGGGAVTVLDAARLAVSLRRTRAAHLDELHDAVDLPLLYVPYLFVRDHGLRGHAHGRRRARRRARPVSPRPDAGRPRSSSSLPPRRSWCSAAPAASARRQSRRRPHSALGAPRRQDARAHHRSRASPRDGARSRRHRQRGAPGAVRPAEGGRRRSAWRALGRDARHQAVVGRSRAALRARTRRPRTRSSRIVSTTTSPRASCRATTTSRWSACSRSTRRVSTT